MNSIEDEFEIVVRRYFQRAILIIKKEKKINLFLVFVVNTSFHLILLPFKFIDRKKRNYNLISLHHISWLIQMLNVDIQWILIKPLRRQILLLNLNQQLCPCQMKIQVMYLKQCSHPHLLERKAYLQKNASFLSNPFIVQHQLNPMIVQSN